MFVAVCNFRGGAGHHYKKGQTVTATGDLLTAFMLEGLVSEVQDEAEEAVVLEPEVPAEPEAEHAEEKPHHAHHVHKKHKAKK